MFEKDGDGMKRLIKGIVCVVLLIGIIGSGLLIYQGHSAYKELVSEHPLQEQVEEIQKREDYTSLDEISPYLIDATISVEDKNFYSHNGVDIAGVARAVLSNLFGIGDPSGGSTISQQLCKNLYVLLLICSASVFLMGISLLLGLPEIISYWVITAMCFVAMGVSTLFVVQIYTVVQIQTPPELVGKIMATLVSVAMCGQPLGQMIYGILFDVFSESAWIVMLIASIASILITWYSRRVFRQLEY